MDTLRFPYYSLFKSQITYSLKDDMGTFFISPETGQLKLLQSLDREKKDLYRLTLVATDNGAHRLSSEAEVMVTYIAFLFVQTRYYYDLL